MLLVNNIHSHTCPNYKLTNCKTQLIQIKTKNPFNQDSIWILYLFVWRNDIVNFSRQPHAIQPMQNLHIGVPLNDNIRRSDLRNASIARDLPAHPGNHSELNLCREVLRRLGNKSNICRVTARKVGGRELVEPEDAVDAAGAVVDSKAEELVGFEVTGRDGAHGLGAGKESAIAREGNWVWGWGGRWGLGESEEVEG